MTRHSVFLRDGCVLPDHVDPLRVAFGQNWTQLETVEAPALDVIIRRAGWHFIWVSGACSRRGMGATEESATQNAVTRALEGVAQRFNAAEFDSLKITHYPGFYVANVTMQSRNIQRNTSLDAADENPSQAILSKISE